MHGQKIQTVREKEILTLLLKGNYRSEFPKSPSKKNQCTYQHPSLSFLSPPSLKFDSKGIILFCILLFPLHSPPPPTHTHEQRETFVKSRFRECYHVRIWGTIWYHKLFNQPPTEEFSCLQVFPNKNVSMAILWYTLQIHPLRWQESFCLEGNLNFVSMAFWKGWTNLHFCQAYMRESWLPYTQWGQVINEHLPTQWVEYGMSRLLEFTFP